MAMRSIIWIYIIALGLRLYGVFHFSYWWFSAPILLIISIIVIYITIGNVIDAIDILKDKQYNKHYAKYKETGNEYYLVKANKAKY